jgi:hypothetical protein
MNTKISLLFNRVKRFARLDKVNVSVYLFFTPKFPHRVEWLTVYHKWQIVRYGFKKNLVPGFVPRSLQTMDLFCIKLFFGCSQIKVAFHRLLNVFKKSFFFQNRNDFFMAVR